MLMEENSIKSLIIPAGEFIARASVAKRNLYVIIFLVLTKFTGNVDN